MRIPGNLSPPSSPRTPHAAPDPGVREILRLCAECEGTRPDLDDCTHEQLMQARGFAETTNDTHAVDLIDQELADRERPGAPMWHPGLAGLAELSLSGSVRRDAASGAPAIGGAATASDFTVPDSWAGLVPAAFALDPVRVPRPDVPDERTALIRAEAELRGISPSAAESMPALIHRLNPSAKNELLYFEKLVELLHRSEQEERPLHWRVRENLLMQAPRTQPELRDAPGVPHALVALMTPEAARLHNEANCLRLKGTPSPTSPYVTLMRTMAEQPAVAAEYEGMAGRVGALTADAMKRALVHFKMRADAVPKPHRPDEPWMAYALRLLGFAPNAR